MLQSTKFEFKVKFSTQYKDVSVTIREGKNPIELKKEHISAWDDGLGQIGIAWVFWDRWCVCLKKISEPTMNKTPEESCDKFNIFDQ